VPEPPEILGLLADPLRWQLIVELGRSDRRVGELVELTGKPQNLAFSGHDRKTLYTVGSNAIYRVQLLASGIKSRGK